VLLPGRKVALEVALLAKEVDAYGNLMTGVATLLPE
jgi:hypothetical protein